MMDALPEISWLLEYLKDPTAQGAGIGFAIVFFYTCFRLFMPLMVAVIGNKKKADKRADSNLITEAEVDEKLKEQYNGCLKLHQNNIDKMLGMFNTHQLQVEGIVNGATAEFQKAVVSIEGKFEVGSQRFGYIEGHVKETKEFMKIIIENMQKGEGNEENYD